MTEFKLIEKLENLEHLLFDTDYIIIHPSDNGYTDENLITLDISKVVFFYIQSLKYNITNRLKEVIKHFTNRFYNVNELKIGCCYDINNISDIENLKFKELKIKTSKTDFDLKYHFSKILFECFELLEEIKSEHTTMPKSETLNTSDIKTNKFKIDMLENEMFEIQQTTKYLTKQIEIYRQEKFEIVFFIGIAFLFVLFSYLFIKSNFVSFN